MTSILGINFGHDGSVAVVHNGKLRSAIAKERCTRVKKDRGMDLETIEYALSAADCSLDEITHVAFSSYIFSPEHAEQDAPIQVIGLNGQLITHDLIHLLGGQSFSEYRIRIKGKILPAILVQHHLAHLSASFFTSPFDRAAGISVDASGVHPEYCSLFGYGFGNKINYLYCPGIMAGNVYSVFTERLGIGPGLTKAGTTMALAAFGERLPYSELWREIFASFYERRFQGNDHIYIQTLWTRLTGLPPHMFFQTQKIPNQTVKNHAASLQYMFERILVNSTQQLFRETQSFAGENLILGGGSFLNSDANMQIALESGFKNFHLFPACGDDGTAAGAALYVLHNLLNEPRVDYEAKDYMYLGKNYLDSTPSKEVTKVAADLLSEGKVIAWYQGRSEFGPRALGNRSILADPRKPELKDRINAEVKHRESYRPFAPSVLNEKTSEWFDITFESKLMLFITQVKKPKLVPAICHIDDSARIQSVAREDNPAYYDLIEAFEANTGIPMLLNTSLNDNGEPLVETPQDAIKLFEKTELDALVFGDEILQK